MSWTDSYKKFEDIADKFDEDEKQEKAELRDENQLSYMKRQRQKQLTWEADMRAQGKDPEKLKREMAKNRCGCASNNMNLAAEMIENAAKAKGVKNPLIKDNKSGGGHGHSHGGEPCHKDHSEPPRPQGPPQVGCGYADPATLRRLAEQKKNTPQLSLPEKNRRKMIAVEATQKDGNKFFKEGNLEHALAVYERGCLIINGCYGMPDEDWEKMQDYEAKLDLNIALIKLKQGDWASCIEHCRMSLNIRKKNPKAFYRWTEALVGMGEYEMALEKNAEALKIHPNSQGSKAQRERIAKLKKEQEERLKQREQEIAANLKKQWGTSKKKKKKDGGGGGHRQPNPNLLAHKRKETPQQPPAPEASEQGATVVSPPSQDCEEVE